MRRCIELIDSMTINYVWMSDMLYWKKCIGDDTKAAARQTQTALRKQKIKKIKNGEKRFSIWRMEFLHHAMWHDHDTDFARWLHPAMWHAALGSRHWIHQVAVGLPCNVTGGSGMTCHWIRQVAALCNVADDSGMTYHWIRPNVRHIGILLLVLISAISPQSTCHSAPNRTTLGRKKNDIMSIFKMADLRHLGF